MYWKSENCIRQLQTRIYFVGDCSSLDSDIWKSVLLQKLLSIHITASMYFFVFLTFCVKTLHNIFFNILYMSFSQSYRRWISEKSYLSIHSLLLAHRIIFIYLLFLIFFLNYLQIDNPHASFFILHWNRTAWTLYTGYKSYYKRPTFGFTFNLNPTLPVKVL